MTEIPVAEVIAERVYAGRHTVRIYCPRCQRLELHPTPADAGAVTAAHCGLGPIRIGDR
jgi:hypothetical protein